MKYRHTEEEIRNAVTSSTSLRQVMTILGLRGAGGNYYTLKKRISCLNIKTDHFLGSGHLKGKNHNWSKKIPLSKILVENSTYASTPCLKGRLIKENVFNRICYKCKLTDWLGKPIPLELEHVNGVSNDNRIENLTLLCPNCHAFTPIYRGKNIKIRRRNSPMAGGKPLKMVSVRVQIPLPALACVDCKVSITKNRTRCKSCAGKQKPTKIVWPTKDELQNIVSQSSYYGAGKLLGVSDNAIRKRLRNH